MAAKCDDPVKPENGKELCRVRDENGLLRGFRREFLTENLSKRDRAFLTCSRCQGILREACNSNKGEQFCQSCKRKGEQTHPIQQVRATVSDLKSSCPVYQRGCIWTGNLRECEKHLEMCSYVHEACKLGCGVVLSRDELRIHSKETCLQRIEECEYCGRKFKYCGLPTHHSSCQKMPVKCKLKCGKLVIREKITQHMDIECKEKEVDCPFVKYSCKVGLMKRKELNQHLEDRNNEHMEMKVNGLEEMVMKQNEIISQLSQKMEALLDPEKYNTALWNVEGITYFLIMNLDRTFTSKEYTLCGFPMIFILTLSRKITIEFRIESRQKTIFPLNTRKGCFITRFVCHNDTRSSLEFNSEYYLIGQPTDLIEKMKYYTKGEIATFSRDLIADNFIRGDGIELEITFDTS
eukprot:TRINITY_DN5671_c0_g1_i3.p1 TRINITY_DN5671_c0_g1~~TRINITY_DN5671_c0_g1_i3.p1  ORF type:complete len:407 (+),score=32.68 TRINITY_DN5671_c0_g1_i3:106-1326(+)